MNRETKKVSSKIFFSVIEEMLAEGRKASFTVTGMSMWPFICHERDQVVVESCDLLRVKVGDIVLFQTPYENYILHRVARLKKGYFETIGDGNCFRDGWFDGSCLRAKVIYIVRKGKIINCDSVFWRAVARIWMFFFPIRKSLLYLLKVIGKIKILIKKTN